MDTVTAKRLGRWLGIGLYVAVGLLYLASGLLVPVFPWLMILNTFWVAGLVLAWRASAARWWIALVSGPIAWLFWVLYISAGESLLGWTA